ncbi:microsomal glutathione S-transferase 1-like [Helicoverpa armigera]|uniref:microsomal glutathione S-transferase 1-like n=1 Tax=Helicoverpa armigera TaxID=29058 RepID=UPI003082A1F5
MVSISLDNPLVQTYIFYSAVLALKLFFVAILTGAARGKKNVYANPEDAAARKGTVKYDDPDVERTRRAHLNDLENIPAFWVLGALYLTTDPVVGWATLLFRAFALARIAHTVVYAVVPLPPPSRGIAFGVSFLVNVYMGVQVVLYYLSAM